MTTITLGLTRHKLHVAPAMRSIHSRLSAKAGRHARLARMTDGPESIRHRRIAEAASRHYLRMTRLHGVGGMS